ncbi:TIGR00341 family protein [Psychrobacter jeotgali]|uniref:TIGR00341 family protein n=1 Tax=Psychrobacter jeotgali TaxID=179010 RepID=UPI0019195342|nr:TIGR00341 family protein [Psychrobacter jeotgali]
MTSSSNNSANSLSKQDSLDNENDPDIGHDEAITESGAEIAQEPLIDHVDNLAEQNIEENENDDEDQEVETECAKAPEPQITMTSPSPDVVIATVETPDLEDLAHKDTPTEQQDQTAPATSAAADEAKQSSSENYDNQASNLENYAEQQDNDNDQVDSDNVDEARNDNDRESINESKVDNSDIDASDIDKTESNQDLEDSEYLDDEKRQEAVEKEKESKLESYKQFIARQFSNQKVDYPEVRVRIEANALPSKMYFVMNMLSAIIASYGLVTNSAAVVIGAMLVAMMLGPITGIALAIIDHRAPLLRKSLFTVITGVSLVVLVGFVVGWLHNEQPLTAEILSRTQPTSMDLMIALAGGTAGAYAMVSPHLSVAVVGVAVATALVPPLAASGILFANGETQLGLGALLLAITNIIAIQFTNALVLWILGFRRLVDDDYQSSTYLTFLRRNAVTLSLLVVLGVYLSINLNKNANQQAFENNVKTAINSYFVDKGNVLTNTQFDQTDEHLTIRAVIRGETTPSSYDVRQLEAEIAQDMLDSFSENSRIKLQLRYLPVQVIEANPLTADKLDKTDAAILTN